jgi:hypothetical protein
MTGKDLLSAGIMAPGACPADAGFTPGSAVGVEREMVRRPVPYLGLTRYALSQNVPRAGSHTRRAFLLILLAGPSARAAGKSIQACYSSPALAFTRYIASQRQPDPFECSARVGVIVEASLPELYKSAGLLAVRTQDENKRAETRILQSVGDGTVGDEVIERYFAVHQGRAVLPPSTTTITPANYTFRFAGQVETGGASAYVYDVRPKTKRRSVIVGQLWMDSRTGREIMLAGYFPDEPAIGGRGQFVRDTELTNGSARARVTHTSFAIPRLGRAELVVTELILPPAE